MNKEETIKMEKEDLIDSFMRNMNRIDNSCKRSTDTMNRIKGQQNRIDCLLNSMK